MNWRSALIFAYDFLPVAAAWTLAFLARFNFDLCQVPPGWTSNALIVAVPVAAISFLGMRLYRGLWRYASLSDLRRILIAVGLATLKTSGARP